jgi:hypothetical protein
MPDLSIYPIQGKLRIRQDNYQRDRDFIQAHVAHLSAPVLRSIPGYDFLKFWYADFAATDAQWAVLAPELDKRNILVTLYESPVFSTESPDEDEKAGSAASPRRPLTWITNGLAFLVILVALTLLMAATIDLGICVLIAALGILIGVGGQLYVRRRGRDGVQTKSSEH